MKDDPHAAFGRAVAERGWQRKTGPVKNPDLWDKLLWLVESRPVTLRWVRGHNGNPGNERADQLAKKGMLGGPRLEDTGYTGRATQGNAQREVLDDQS